MKSRNFRVFSVDRSDNAKILLNCAERALIIGFASMIIANSIHNSQDRNALKFSDRQQSPPQALAEIIDNFDRN